MQQYMVLAVMIRFVVDFLLLFAVKQLFSPFSGFLRPLLGAFVGGVYAACSVVPGLTGLRENLWYGVSLLLCSFAAFGMERTAISSTAVYCILRLALDGLASGSGYVAELLLGILLSVLSVLGFGRGQLGKRYIPVELRYQEKKVHLQALWDTGHDLCDPITGKSVLVVGSDVAQLLTGLSQDQLQKPIDSIGIVPGLRLIPYQTVDNAGNMMLAMQIPYARVGRKKGTCLVAFAPQVLDSSGKFQGLIGGTV